jgi:ubiquinone/menaquinone biosynthesis C-methylase UbiE
MAESFDRERPSFEDSNNVTVKRCFFAYEWAVDYVKGKNTADIGCADGYGTQYLAQHVNTVIGVDYSEATLIEARKKYGQLSNLSFISGSVPPLPLESNSLDSFSIYRAHSR